MKNLRNSKGFTLIELMIVVVIIGILAAIAIPKFTSVSNGAKQAEAAPVLKQMCTLAESIKLKEGTYPATLADLTGWDDPTAEYFTFTYAAGVATAAPGGVKGAQAGLGTQTLTCSTNVMTDPVIAAG